MFMGNVMALKIARYSDKYTKTHIFVTCETTILLLIVFLYVTRFFMGLYSEMLSSEIPTIGTPYFIALHCIALYRCSIFL